MPDDKEPIPKFAARIKAKYPQYKDMNDTLLTQKIIEKYPQYKEMVDFTQTAAQPTIPQVEPPKQEDIWDKLNKEAAAQQPTQEQIDKSVGKKPTVDMNELQSDPFKAILNPVRQDVIKQSKDYLTAKNQPISESTSQKKLSAKNIVEKNKIDYDVNEISTNPQGIIGSTEQMVADQLFPNGKKAEEYIAKVSKDKGEPVDNETFSIAKAKADRYNELKNSINSNGGYLIMTALDEFYKSHPQEKKRVEATGDRAPDVLEGRALSNFLTNNKEDLDQMAADDPHFKHQYEKQKAEIREDFPDFGINQIQNELSRARQNRGLNNAVYTPRTDEFIKQTDKLAGELYKDDPVSKGLYEQYKDDILIGIDKPGVVNRFFGGIEHGVKGTIQSFRGATPSENISEKLKEEYGAVQSGEKGLQKTLGQIGDLGGFVTYMALQGKVGVPSRVAVATTFFGDMLKEGDNKYPDNRDKALASAVGNTAALFFLQDAIPINKINKALSGVKTEISKSLDALKGENITKEAVKDATMNGVKNGIELIGGAAKQHLRTVTELGIWKLADISLDKAMMGKEQFNETHPANEMSENLKLNSIINIPLSLIGGYGDYAKRNFVKESVYDVAASPNRYNRILESSNLPESQKAKIKEQIGFLNQTKGLLDENGVSESNQKKYLLHAANEKNLEANKAELTAKAESIADPTLKSVYEKQVSEIDKHIKESQKIKESILKGKEEVEEKLPQEDIELKEEDQIPIHEEKPLVSVIKPEENKVAEPIPLIKPEGGQDALRQRLSEEEISRNVEPGGNIPESSERVRPSIEGDESPGTRIPEEKGENTGKEEGVKPPISEPPKGTKIHFEPPATELSHRGLQVVANEFSLPDVQTRETKSDLQLRTDAQRKANEWAEKGEYGKNVEGLVKKAEGGEVLTDEQRVILEQHLANVSGELRGMDIKSPEYDAKLGEIKRLKDAGEKTRSEAGAALRIPMGGSRPKDLADMMVEEMDISGTDVLTEKQKETVKVEYENLEKAKKEFDEYVAAKEAEFVAKQGKTGFEKQRPKAKTKKTKEDFKTERKSLKEELAAAKKEHEDWLKSQGIQKMGIGSFTVKEAKVIGKIVKSYAEEGIQKFEEVIKKVIDEVKDLFPGIDEKDINNIVAGVYNEKKATRSELAARLMDWKIEANLVNKLEAFERGEEPKSEKKRIERNKQITELRGKIKSLQEAEAKAEKDIKDFEKEVAKKETATTLLKAKEGKGIEKELSKAEKEQEKEEQRKMAEVKKAEEVAQKEEEKFIREFEKEKDSEEKRRAKAAVDAAKDLATKLAKKTKTEIAIERQKTKMANEIKELEYKLKTGDFDKESAPKKQSLKLDEEGLKLKDKLIKLKQQREIRLLQQEYQNRNKFQRFGDTALEVLNVPRTIMSSTDFSAPLRQGLIASISHPRTAAKAGATMFQHAFSQKEFDRWFHDLKESKNYELMNESGLYVADPHDPRLTAKEEAFMNNLAEKIPVIGKVIKGSERAYVSYLNKMRVDLFNRFAERYMEQGKTYKNSPELYEKMADYINNTTGRGKLLKVGKFDLEAAAPILNTTLFSPRLIASRLNLLNPIYYAKLPKEVRVMAAKDMLKFLGLGMTVLALAKLNGADVEDDPRSTDFGKIKSGNTRWDIWGGFQQYVRLAAQMVSGEKKAGETIKELNGEQAFGETRGDVLGRFGRGKLAPVPSMLTDFISGRTVTGDKPTVGGEAESHLLPLLYSDIKQAMKDQGVSSLFSVAIPASFGVGVQTFQPKETKTKPKKPTKSKPKKQEKK